MTNIVTPTMRRFIAARTAMLFDQPLWGQLALRLHLVEDPSCNTAWTDGRSIGYNPVFIATLNQRELVGLVAHEVEHCTRGHPWRRGGRDPKLWNVAGDRVINPDLRQAGFTLPEGALYELEPSHLGKSTEWVYDRLPREQNGGEGGEGKDGQQGGSDGASGQGQGEKSQDPGPNQGFDEVRDAPTSAGEDGEAPPSEEDWRQAVQQAAASARAAGRLPGGAERMVKEATQSRIDWRTALHRFAVEVARNDYSWRLPARRYLPQGLYLPTLLSQEMGVLVVAVDTSGSIDDVLLAQFGGELQGIVEETKPRKVHVMYCDTRVHRTDTFDRGDPVTLKAVGRGGTDFRPVFDAVEKLDEEPAAVIYLTDLDGRFPAQDPGIPTLWVTGRSAWAVPKVPFGEVVTAG